MKKKAFLLMGMGLEVGILVWLFVHIGQKWDRELNTDGWITAGLGVLALLLWFFHLIRILKNNT